MQERKVYLDYNATTPLGDEAREGIEQSLLVYGNASSMHASGREARARIEQARKSVSDLIGAGTEEIFFTSGGSESNNTVFQSARDIITNPGLCKHLDGRNEIITTAIEHPCVLNSAKYLKSLGFKVIILPVDEYGKVKLEDYKKSLNRRTLLVSVMYANNETGVIQDIMEISSLAKEAGALFHTDAVQAAGKVPLDVNEISADYLTMSCHKIYGPKGIGALYKRRGVFASPLIHGGHQEDGLRAGTYNNLGILGFGAAALAAKKNLAAYGENMRSLRTRLMEGLLRAVPNIKVNSHPTDVLPNTLNVSFPGAEGEAILLSLDIKGIEVSTGSACASGSLEPSHVLTAIGVSPELAHGSVRFSMGWGNTGEDIDYVLEVMPPLIARLRSMSTAGH